jgi:hypothetical protein
MPAPASGRKRVEKKVPSSSEESSSSDEDSSKEESSDEDEDADEVTASLHVKRAGFEAKRRSAACAKLCREGGRDFVNFMLTQAVGPGTNSSKLPNKSPRDWTFQDLSRLPLSEQEEWRRACLEEIDALTKRDVFELVELPKGRKAIRGRWVFDAKSDGRKCARYVAKGFSQIEGIDYEALFSPVVRYESV